MKRVLLGTTALVAAGLLVTSVAYADEEMAEEEMMEPQPVTVGLSGYTTGAIGFGSDSSNTQRGHNVGYVFEVGISGSTTLDNGVTVGVHGQLGATGGPDQAFDEIYTTLSGAFGTLELGRTEDANFKSTVGAPGAAIGGMIGVNFGWFTVGAAGINTYDSGIFNSDALKVGYASPNFNGLTVRLSYAPEDDEGNLPARVIGDGNGGHTAVGLMYSTDFMDGGSVTIGAGYEMAENEAAGGADPEAMSVGISVGVDQLLFGGGMYAVDNGPTEYDVGASWTEGPMELGIQFALNEAGALGDGTPATHMHVGGAEVAVAAVPGPTGETTMTAAHLTYTLGPGILIGGQIAAGTFDGLPDVTQFMLGTAIFF